MQELPLVLVIEDDPDVQIILEDALTEGLIQVGSAETMGQSRVILTPRARAVLDGKSQSQVDDSDFGKERGGNWNG